MSTRGFKIECCKSFQSGAGEMIPRGDDPPYRRFLVDSFPLAMSLPHCRGQCPSGPQNTVKHSVQSYREIKHGKTRCPRLLLEMLSSFRASFFRRLAFSWIFGFRPRNPKNIVLCRAAGRGEPMAVFRGTGVDLGAFFAPA